MWFNEPLIEENKDLFHYIHKEPKVLTALADFCQTSKKQLIDVLMVRFEASTSWSVTLNDIPTTQQLNYLYIQRKKQKVWVKS